MRRALVTLIAAAVAVLLSAAPVGAQPSTSVLLRCDAGTPVVAYQPGNGDTVARRVTELDVPHDRIGPEGFQVHVVADGDMVAHTVRALNPATVELVYWADGEHPFRLVDQTAICAGAPTPSTVPPVGPPESLPPPTTTALPPSPVVTLPGDEPTVRNLVAVEAATVGDDASAPGRPAPSGLIPIAAERLPDTGATAGPGLAIAGGLFAGGLAALGFGRRAARERARHEAMVARLCR